MCRSGKAVYPQSGPPTLGSAFGIRAADWASARPSVWRGHGTCAARTDLAVPSHSQPGSKGIRDTASGRCMIDRPPCSDALGTRNCLFHLAVADGVGWG